MNKNTSMKLEQDMILTSKIFALLVQKRYLNMTHVNRYNVYVRICKILAHTYYKNCKQKSTNKPSLS